MLRIKQPSTRRRKWAFAMGEDIDRPPVTAVPVDKAYGKKEMVIPAGGEGTATSAKITPAAHIPVANTRPARTRRRNRTSAIGADMAELLLPRVTGSPRQSPSKLAA